MTEMPKTITIEYSARDDKRHSVRWDADDKDAVLSTVYIRKPEFQNAKRIRVTVEEVE